jgi:hypothetical protein
VLLLEHPLIEDQEHEQEKELRNAIANSASVDSPTRAIDFCRRENTRQGSSVVEQGTHKPLVGSSTLPPGTNFLRERLGVHPTRLQWASLHRFNR